MNNGNNNQENNPKNTPPMRAGRYLSSGKRPAGQAQQRPVQRQSVQKQNNSPEINVPAAGRNVNFVSQELTQVRNATVPPQSHEAGGRQAQIGQPIRTQQSNADKVNPAGRTAPPVKATGGIDEELLRRVYNTGNGKTPTPPLSRIDGTVSYEKSDRETVQAHSQTQVHGQMTERSREPGQTSGRYPAQSAASVQYEPYTPGRAAVSKKKQRKREAAEASISNLLKAVIYIVFVLVISGFLSYFIITVANDVFAFVKTDAAYDITFEDVPTLEDIAKVLSAKGIIKYPQVFVFYTNLRNKNSGFVSGSVKVNSSMNYDSILLLFKKRGEKEQVSITIPEGYTVDEIIDIFVSHGMGTKEGFVEAIQNYPFNYWFVNELNDLPKTRKYRLEGYLYPETYYFFTDWSEVNILYKILEHFNTIFTETYKPRCEELGYTVDEIITLASLIQSEAKFQSEYSTVSSVFHNRLNNPSVTNGKLDSDAAIQYILEERRTLVGEDTKIDNPYNTYIYAGFPPGPVSNPSKSAIYAALYPAETDYYYFVAKQDGTTLFAKTYAEQLANIKIARGSGN